MKYIKRTLAVFAVWLVACMCVMPAFAEITPHNPDVDIFDDDIDSSYNEDSGGDSTYSEESYEEESGTAGGYTEDESSWEESSKTESSKQESSKQQESSKKEVSASSAAGNGIPVNANGNDAEEQYVVIGKIESSQNDVSSGVTLLGIGLIALGVVGIVCVIVWSWASGRTSKSPDEEIYEAVGMADARNRAVREEPRGAKAPAYRDSYNAESSGQQPVRRGRASQQTLDPIPTMPARREERIVPQDARGAVQQNGRPPQHSRVEPGHAAPRRPAQRPAAQQQRPAVPPPQRPATQQRSPQPRGRASYDTDEIIREALKKRD